jgi:hypothetical protein
MVSAVTFPKLSTVTVTLPSPRPACLTLKGAAAVVDTSVVKPGSVVVPGFGSVAKLTNPLLSSPEHPPTDSAGITPSNINR